MERSEELMQFTGTGNDDTLARAVEATSRLKNEIDELWFDSMMSDDTPVSERLCAVSHAIRNVFHLLGHGQAIG